MDTAIAFLIFNRPDCTRRTFAAIREVRPPRLLVVADGPRVDRPGEAELCAEARAVVDGGVDWPCQVETNFSPSNLGCRRRVSSGLDWVFSQVEEAFILEDDCLPHPDFFRYGETLLARYRHEGRVMSVSGDNFLSEEASGASSYRFSHVAHIWGWATWRRAWRQYDLAMTGWPEFRRRGGLRALFGDHGDMVRTWTGMMERTYRGKIDTWDFQWMFSCFARGGLHVVPRRNLVTNIGFSAAATHTHDIGSWQANLPVHAADDILRAPAEIAADTAADYKTYCLSVGSDAKLPFLRRCRRRLGRGLRHVAAGLGIRS